MMFIHYYLKYEEKFGTLSLQFNDISTVILLIADASYYFATVMRRICHCQLWHICIHQFHYLGVQLRDITIQRGSAFQLKMG